MAKAKSKLNQASSEVIQENILKENPAGLPDEATGIISHSTHIPEMRKVIFLNGRDPGVALHFHYHSKTHPLKQYTLYHGFEHELDVEVINHLESCAERIYGYRKTAQGMPEHYVKSLKYIFSFKNPSKQASYG